MEPSTNQNLSVDRYFIFLCLKGNGLQLNPKAVLLEEPWAQWGRAEGAVWGSSLSGCWLPGLPHGVSAAAAPAPASRAGVCGHGDGDGDGDGRAQQRVRLQEPGLLVLRAADPA